MARPIPEDRLEKLVECATRVFINQGYARTQMADIATALGVAKGTLYLYVESKEALFDLVARVAASDASVLKRLPLPVATPKPGTTLRFAREQLAKRQTLPKLTAALAAQRAKDIATELEEIVRELYHMLRDNRVGIKLIDRAAPEYPELGDLWFRDGRGALLALVTAYVEDRTRRRLFRRLPDVSVAARMVLETTSFWAVHRHWDPHPQKVDDKTAEDTVVQFVKGALLEK